MIKQIKTTATKIDLTKMDMRNEWKSHCNKYRCTIDYNNNKLSFNLYMGKGLTRRPNKLDIIEAMALDSQAGKMSFDEFCCEFGYDKKDRRIYNNCVKAYNRMSKLFTDEQIDELREESYH